MTTGQKIQTLRKRQGMTQEQLAQRLGVSRQAVSRWELDEVLPETANLLPLSRALGVSVDSLLDPAAEAAQPAPSPAAARVPAAPSLRALIKRRLWLLLLPVEGVLLGALALWRIGNAPSLAGIILVQGLWLCLWLYLLLLVVYFLAAGIRYLHQRRPPQ